MSDFVLMHSSNSLLPKLHSWHSTITLEEEELTLELLSSSGTGASLFWKDRLIEEEKDRSRQTIKQPLLLNLFYISINELKLIVL